MIGKCHQRIIREQEAHNQTPNPWEGWLNTIDTSTAQRSVTAITRREAEPVIVKYEWLGTLPKNYSYYAGLFLDGHLAGVACFTRSVFGGRYRAFGHDAWCLGRGACVHWAPSWAGSYLVSHACRLFFDGGDPTYVVGYSDWSAGEIGTIYQACNWTYLGDKNTREYRGPDGKRLDVNTPRVRACTGFARGKDPSLRAAKEDVERERLRLLADGYVLVPGPRRGRYAGVYGRKGSTKRELQRLLAENAKPYPKRKAQDVGVDTPMLLASNGESPVPFLEATAASGDTLGEGSSVAIRLPFTDHWRPASVTSPLASGGFNGYR